MKYLNIIFTAFLFILISNTYAQVSLDLSLMKELEYNFDTEEWDGLSSEWENIEEENYTLKFTVLDNESTEFLVEFLDGESYDFATVIFTKYNRTNAWFEYETDVDSEEQLLITVDGANLTSLAINGFPEKPVLIYFWNLTEGFAFVFYNE